MKKEKLNSVAIAIFLCANPLSWIVPSFSNVIVLVVLLAWAAVLMNGELSKIIRVPIYVHLFTLTCVVFFLYSLNINYRDAATFNYFLSFVVFGITGVYFSNLSFSINTLFKAIGIISLILIFYVYRIDFGDPTREKVDYGMWMGVSYGILRLILGLFVLVLFYRADFGLLRKLVIYFLILAYAYIYSQYASRGAILSVFVFLLLFYLIKGQLSEKRKLMMIGVGLGLTIGIFNLETIITGVNDLLLNFEIKVLALSKLLILLEAGQVDNGRGHLIEKGLDGFYEYPLLGQGIAAFENQFGYYIHNVFMQVLYEGGIIFLIPIVAIFLFSVSLMFNFRIELEKRVFLLFLLCGGIFELLFSSVYWLSVFFWFFIFYSLRLFIDYKKRKI